MANILTLADCSAIIKAFRVTSFGYGFKSRKRHACIILIRIPLILTKQSLILQLGGSVIDILIPVKIKWPLNLGK
jgi:hypothetical protein